MRKIDMKKKDLIESLRKNMSLDELIEKSATSDSDDQDTRNNLGKHDEPENRNFSHISMVQDKDVDKKDIISDSDLRTYYRCPYGYFLRKHRGLNRIPISAFVAQTMFFEHDRKRLFTVGKDLPSQRRAGPGTKHVEEMDADELRQFLRFKSPDSYGEHLYGTWLAILKKNRYAGSEISWTFPGQDHKGATWLRMAGHNYFNLVLEHGAPIMGFMDKRMSFSFRGHYFRVRFPELRKGMLIDDPSIWSFSADLPGIEKRKDARLGSLVTLRMLGYCTLAHQIPHLRRKWGIPFKIADLWGGVEKHIGEDVRYRHLNCSKGLLTETRRDDSDLGQLLWVVDDFLENIRQERFSPNHRYCGECPYNSLDQNGAIVCNKAKRGKKPSRPKFYLKKNNFKIISEETDKGFRLEGVMVKNSDVSKHVAGYEFMFKSRKGNLVAESVYNSRVHGDGFEEKMLERADEELQRFAEKSRKTISHKVNFSRDFDYDGKKSIRLKLQQLGYEHNKKVYNPKREEEGEGQMDLFR